MTVKGSNANLNEIAHLPETPVLNNEKSEIAEFFAGTNVLVTGGTGFLGILLIEKLLRSCPDIATLYMIVRPKKGKNSQDRFKETFDNVVYDRLKREQPNFLNKVVLIEGDASLEDFGLSLESKEILTNTNIIFHAAANVRFDETLRSTANTNVKAIKYILLFAKQLQNLKAFVHVSTAFSHCILKTINEVHYKPPIQGDELLTLMDILDDDKIEKLTPVLLDKWPNTYVFTKAIGESIVLKYSDNFPVCIVRPSIVLSTEKEPIVGWTNNLYGATGAVVASYIGLLHTIHCKEKNVAELIPADYVVSNIIAAAWDVAHRKSLTTSNNDSNIPDEERVPIFNSVSSCQNPTTWKDFLKQNEVIGLKIPSSRMQACYFLLLTKYLFLYRVYTLLFHIIPAVIIDTLTYLIGRKPMLLNVYKKIHKFSRVIHYFSTQEWQFNNDNVMKLWQKMNSIDRQTFNFNIENLDWDMFIYYYIRGVRVYLLNDPLSTIEEANIKYNRIRKVYYTVITVISLLLLWRTVSFTYFLWSYCPLSH
ncbi:fatty acyl-CoA reductase wat [Ptiloglossa arizonensis]|uniref:fatty acyl-CoA reductase wat n=1 Tax=Ptiloglossa arizonensis TaxID=3350558 RepID=UPI003FA0886A